jgi:hypothetical protein
LISIMITLFLTYQLWINPKVMQFIVDPVNAQLMLLAKWI